jgi:hypothetical protein
MSATTTAAAEPQDDIPEDILEAKLEMEAKTGKKFKYRAPREDIKTLLLIGAVQDQPKTFTEAVKYGLVLGTLFVLSFIVFYALFLQYPSKYRGGKMDLAKRFQFQKVPPSIMKQQEVPPKFLHDTEL